MTPTPLCQIALSVSDHGRSRAWYESLGFVPSGRMPPFRGDALAARILELPEIELGVHWLRGRDPMSQLELMEFRTPAPRPLPEDFGPRHQGYGIVGLVVPDFAGVRARLAASRSPYLLTGPSGRQSVWTRDPDGIPVEIMEKDPLGAATPAPDPEATGSIRSVTLTVTDVGKAIRFWTAAIGLARPSPQLSFNPFPSSLARGADRWEQEALLGGTLILRLLKPSGFAVVPRGADYRLSDIGVLNVAAIVDSAEDFSQLTARVCGLGYRLTSDQAMEMGDAGAVYGYDDQRVSIEMGYVVPGCEAKYGWRR